jgi:hypothetical protein
MMHGHEKSRSVIVAVKPMNKAERSAAESVERRAETKGNVDQQRTRRTQRRISVSQMLARIRQHIVAVDTRGGNRMRESCTYGSVRGVRGNSHPYRDVAATSVVAVHESADGTQETCQPRGRMVRLPRCCGRQCCGAVTAGMTHNGHRSPRVNEIDWCHNA